MCRDKNILNIYLYLMKSPPTTLIWKPKSSKKPVCWKMFDLPLLDFVSKYFLFLLLQEFSKYALSLMCSWQKYTYLLSPVCWCWAISISVFTVGIKKSFRLFTVFVVVLVQKVCCIPNFKLSSGRAYLECRTFKKSPLMWPHELKQNHR